MRHTKRVQSSRSFNSSIQWVNAFNSTFSHQYCSFYKSLYYLFNIILSNCNTRGSWNLFSQKKKYKWWKIYLFEFIFLLLLCLVVCAHVHIYMLIYENVGANHSGSHPGVQRRRHQWLTNRDTTVSRYIFKVLYMCIFLVYFSIYVYILMFYNFILFYYLIGIQFNCVEKIIVEC